MYFKFIFHVLCVYWVTLDPMQNDLHWEHFELYFHQYTDCYFFENVCIFIEHDPNCIQILKTNRSVCVLFIGIVLSS